jgi:hypothetical protein
MSDWRGARGLRKHLRPIDELVTYPGNPRRGVVEKIMESLERFGQVRPILADADGQVVSGNHTLLAARELGWTEVAVVVGDFASPEEARAYLLADNRLAELGDYEKQELLALLESVEGSGSWEGTGYAPDELEDLRFLLDQVPVTAPEPFRGGYADEGELERRRLEIGTQTSKHEVVLALEPERHRQFGVSVKIIQKETEDVSEGVADTVLRAVRARALALNQG